MHQKYLIFYAAVIFGVPLAIALASSFRHLRDALFFGLVFGTVLMSTLDINFMVEQLYRGTTRGFEISFMDLFAVVLIASTFLSGERRRVWYWPGSLGLMILFFLYCVFSVAISEPKLFGLFELSKVFRGIIIFLAAALFVRGEREIRILLAALCCGMVYVTGMALYQRYGMGWVRAEGPFMHPNNLSIYCVTAGPVLAAAAMSNIKPLLRYACGVCAILAGGVVILSVSRTGYVAFFMVIFGVMAVCMGGQLTDRKLAVISLVLLVSVAGVAKSWDSVAKRLFSRTFADEFINRDKGRGHYFRLGYLVVQDHFLGVGLNNWSYIVTDEYYPKIGLESTPYPEDISNLTQEVFHSTTGAHRQHQMAPPAHNLAVLVAGELGIPGSIIFWAMWGRWYHMAYGFWRDRNAALWSRFPMGVAFGLTGAFLQCLTEYAYRHTPVYFLVHLLVGSLAALYYLKQKNAFTPLVRVRRHGAPLDASDVEPFPPSTYPEGIVYD